MHPLLDEIDRLLRQTTSEAEVDALTRPIPGKWSAAEVLEHLALTYGATTGALKKALVSGEVRGTKPHMRQRVAGAVVMRLGVFPRREAPVPVRPTGQAAETVLGVCADNLRALDTVLSECEERFGGRALIATHPFFGGLTAGGWRRFHLVHTRHHMKQVAERLSR